MSTAATIARDEAIRQVDEAADERWKEIALECVRLMAILEPELTTDDLWEYIERPVEPRAIGPIMLRAQRLGFIQVTNRTRQSERVECHARPLRVWSSLICGRR